MEGPALWRPDPAGCQGAGRPGDPPSSFWVGSPKSCPGDDVGWNVHCPPASSSNGGLNVNSVAGPSYDFSSHSTAFQRPLPSHSSRKSSGDVRSRQSGEHNLEASIPHPHALPWMNAVQQLKSADLLAARPPTASWMRPKSGGIQSAPRRGWVRPYRGSPDDAPMISQAPSARQCAG